VSLFVALLLLVRKLVDPAEFHLAFLAKYVTDVVTPSKHCPFLDIVGDKVDHIAEQVGAAGRAVKPGRDELAAVRQHRVAVGARVQSRPADMLKEHAAH